MDREQQVLWLGLLLIAANFFFSGQFRTVWSVFTTKPSKNTGSSTPLIPTPILPIIPPVPGLPAIPLSL